MTAADVGTDGVRGRYTAGVVEGEAVNGFTHDSDVETFVAVRAYIDNGRWAGVPFRLVTGKRMPSRTTEVVVSFKPVSHWIYERPDRNRARPNRLRMRLQPAETIELGLMGSLAAPDWGATELQPMSLDLSISSTPRRRMAYERLLVDAPKGDQTLFVRDDEVEAAWRRLDSVSAARSSAATPVQDYRSE